MAKKVILAVAVALTAVWVGLLVYTILGKDPPPAPTVQSVE